jgi:hypothetical protein
MDKTTSCLVYWLHDDRCVCPWRHGYIGISTNWFRRLKRHRTNLGVFQWKHLFTGSIEQCLKLERQLRPKPGIGWNEAPGGWPGGGAAPKKRTTRELMRAAALRRYADPAERERTKLIVRAVFKNIDRTGASNGHFGKSTTEAAKQKMRDAIAARGGVSGKRNPNYRHGRYVKT